MLTLYEHIVSNDRTFSHAEVGEHKQKARVKQQMSKSNAIWRERPLPDHLVQYAVDDVKLLDKAVPNLVCV